MWRAIRSAIPIRQANARGAWLQASERLPTLPFSSTSTDSISSASTGKSLRSRVRLQVWVLVLHRNWARSVQPTVVQTGRRIAKGNVRVESHPISRNAPDWYSYPHWHPDFSGKPWSKMHWPLIEPAVGVPAAAYNATKDDCECQK